MKKSTIEKYESIDVLRNQDKSWEYIAKIYNTSSASVRAFKSKYKDAYAAYKNKPKKNVLQKNMKEAEKSEGFVNAYHEREGHAYLAIQRTDYGQIPPTNYVSTLSHTEWQKKYIEYDVNDNIEEFLNEWNLDYLDVLRETIWTESDVIALLPRGYGKTEAVINLFVRWFLEVKKSIYIVSPSSAHNKMLLSAIERRLKSPLIRAAYGDVIGRINYDSQLMNITYHKSIHYVQFEKPISLVTWEGAKEGVHPYWIHYEDVKQKERVGEEVAQRELDKYSATFDKMRKHGKYGTTKVTLTATRYAPNDFYQYLHDKFGFRFHHVPVKTDGVYLTCPNHSEESLKEMEKNDPISFETQMQNNPVPSTGDYFEESEWLTYDNNIPSYNGVITLDPAGGKSKASDNTAIIVSVFHNNKIYVDTIIIGKYSVDEIYDHLIQLRTKYGNNFPIVAEKQFALGNVLFNRLQGLPNLIPFRDNTTNAKYIRIDNMKPFFRDGQILINEKANDYDKLHSEYLRYNRKPSTISRHDDGIDALSMGVSRLANYIQVDSGQSLLSQAAMFN